MKKLLALLLAALMLLSVVPMAGAASFKVSADVTFTNVEAVDILSDLKVFSGFPEGDFKPNDSLTRAQAAKILCCILLGNEGAEALAPAGPTFSDVPAYHWANKYVEQCASRGVVSGVGGGKFDPSGKLTCHAFGKMLLVALGEDAEQFTGDAWTENVSTRLRERRLDYGVTIDEKEISRQAACRLALNTMFSGEKEDVEATLAYKCFGVVRASAGNNDDEFRRPIIKYTANDGDTYWSGTEKMVTASPAIFKKSGKITGGDLVKILGETEIEPARFVQFHNGTKRNPLKETGMKVDSKTTVSYTGAGVQTEIYYAFDTDKFTAVQLWQYAEKITAVTPAVIAADGTVETPGSVTFENGWSCASNEFKESDVGNYACVYAFGTRSIHKPTKALKAYPGTIVSGKLADYVLKKGKSQGVKIGKKTYKFSGRYGDDSNAKKYLENGGAVGDEVNVLLSNDNFVLAVWKKEG